jgi:hypothetical protein
MDKPLLFTCQKTDGTFFNSSPSLSLLHYFITLLQVAQDLIVLVTAVGPASAWEGGKPYHTYGIFYKIS